MKTTSIPFPESRKIRELIELMYDVELKSYEKIKREDHDDYIKYVARITYVVPGEDLEDTVALTVFDEPESVRCYVSSPIIIKRAPWINEEDFIQGTGARNRGIIDSPNIYCYRRGICTPRHFSIQKLRVPNNVLIILPRY